MFFFVFYDKKKDCIIVVCDFIGIIIFYQGWFFKEFGIVYFVFELKFFYFVCDKIEVFFFGYIFDSLIGERIWYFEFIWWDGEKIFQIFVDFKKFCEIFERFVRKRLMVEVFYGVFFFGGFDFLFVVFIVQREILCLKKFVEEVNGVVEEKFEDLDKGEGFVGFDDEGKFFIMIFFFQFNFFFIGFFGFFDNEVVFKVVKFFGIKYYVMIFIIEDGFNVLFDVIYYFEIYDVIIICVLIFMYLFFCKIKVMGIKMVFFGEGFDEIFGGYFYFYGVFNKEEFYIECVCCVKNFYLVDCLCVNKFIFVWGFEVCVFFFDKEFFEVLMNIDFVDKMINKERMEKYIFCKVFDILDDLIVEFYFFDNIFWCQKEQFFDGVGYGWIDVFKDNVEFYVIDEMMKNFKFEWGSDIFDIKEVYWYCLMFDEYFFQLCVLIVMRWIFIWFKQMDFSGR